MDEAQNNSPPTRSLQVMAESAGVSRQSFHRWQVQPEALDGKQKRFTLAAVLENRLQAAQRSSTPAEAELERLDARADLLSEQIEAQRIRNAEAEAEALPAPAVAAVVAAVLDQTAQIIEHLPNDMLDENPRLAQARGDIEVQVGKAASILRAEAQSPEQEQTT